MGILQAYAMEGVGWLVRGMYHSMCLLHCKLGSLFDFNMLFCRTVVENKPEEDQTVKGGFVGIETSAAKYVSF